MQPKTPNLRKMQEVREYSQRIGEFLDWAEERGMRLCERFFVEEWQDEGGYDGYGYCPICDAQLDLRDADPYPYFMPFAHSLNKLLAEFFEIDYEEAERERDELLLSLRDQQGGD